MSFSTEWEKQYEVGRHKSVWPWSDVVSLIFRYAKKLSDKTRVLEVGCGAGANILFFEKLGVQYFAVEGSISALNVVHQQYPKLKKQIVEGDFTRLIPFDGQFDIILDRASITHNTHDEVINALELLWEKLAPGGLFVGVDWFSQQHKEYKEGTFYHDEFTRIGTTTGQFAGVGPVHFANEESMRRLFRGYEIIMLQHKVNDTLVPEETGRFASWNIVAKKPL